MHLKNIAAIAVVMILSLTLLSACGGGDGGGDMTSTEPADTTVARIDIARNAVLLTEPGQSTVLSAQAYNAADEPVDAVFTWSASNPNNVAVVMDTGEITSGVPGSSVITASVGGVISNPVVTVHAAPVAGAILVDDVQVISEPVAIDHAATASVGAQFVVTLSGITQPAPGAILIGSETIPLAGRVVSSQPVVGSATDTFEVTLEIVPINEVFDNFVFKEVIDLSKVKMVPSPDAAQYYSMSRGSDGSYIFDLKPDAIDPATGEFAKPKVARVSKAQTVRPLSIVTGTVANPTFPFVCKRSGPSFNANNGNQIFSISPVGSITINPDPDPIFEYDENIGGLQKIGLNTTVTFKSEFKITISAALEGKIDCKLELLQPNIPLPGPVGFLLGIQLPIGAGIELAGKVTLADVSLTIKAEAEAMLSGALVCPLGVCGNLQTSAETTGSLNPDINFPPGFDGNILADLRFEPSLTGYGFLDLKFGPVLFPAAQVTLVENKVGLAHKANLSFVKTQIANTDYSSDYKLEINASTALGSEITNAINLLGVTPFTAPKFEIAIPLTTSPTAASIIADVDEYQSGDIVQFDIALNADTINYFPLFYNVDEILIYRRITDVIFGDTITQVASVSASSGQTDFTTTWTADSDGSVSDNFFAFVDTTLMPIPYLGELELGKVNAPLGANKILFQRNAEIYAMDRDGSNQINLTNSPRRDHEPVVSPDKNKILFISDRDFNNEIYVMDSDGSNQLNLSNSDLRESSPSWSPDGSKILFIRRDGDQLGIYTMNADGTNQVRLVAETIGEDYYKPSWSPDGTKILFIAEYENNEGHGVHGVFVMNADGTGQENLTPAYDDDDDGMSEVIWSPDGNRIAFTAFSVSNGTAMYILNSDGSNLEQVIAIINSYQFAIAWSPDGKGIMYETRLMDNNREIFYFDVIAGSQVNLTNNTQPGSRDVSASWSSDGGEIIFTSNRNGNEGIYIMDSDGANQTKIPNTTIFDGSAIFQ